MFWFFIFITSFNYSYAQAAENNPLVLLNISEQNGLSDDHVQCVLKDKNVFVWIGTSDRLNLMDGSSIKIFGHSDNDRNSFISNNIISIAEEKDENIWIGTNEGLSCYLRSEKKFISIIVPSSSYGASKVIYTIIIDKQSRIWCCTDGGLFLYSPALKNLLLITISARGRRLQLETFAAKSRCSKSSAYFDGN